MTYHDADGTIVKGIVGFGVKERALQDASGETDLIGGRIIIGIHRLRCHVPIITIHRFAYTMVIVPFLPETATLTHVLIVRFFGVYLKGSKVCPLVRIAHLHIEGIQLEKCIHLRRVVHPVLCCDTFAKGYLQILHECQHALLRRLWEELLGIDLTKGLTHHTLHLGSTALPEGMIFLTT